MRTFFFDVSDQDEFVAPAPAIYGAHPSLNRIELQLLGACSILDTDPATTRWQRIELRDEDLLDRSPDAAPRREAGPKLMTGPWRPSSPGVIAVAALISLIAAVVQVFGG